MMRKAITILTVGLVIGAGSLAVQAQERRSVCVLWEHTAVGTQVVRYCDGIYGYAPFDAYELAFINEVAYAAGEDYRFSAFGIRNDNGFFTWEYMEKEGSIDQVIAAGWGIVQEGYDICNFVSLESQVTGRSGGDIINEYLSINDTARDILQATAVFEFLCPEVLG